MGLFSLFKKKKKATEVPVEEPKKELTPQPENEVAATSVEASEPAVETAPAPAETPAQ